MCGAASAEKSSIFCSMQRSRVHRPRKTLDRHALVIAPLDQPCSVPIVLSHRHCRVRSCHDTPLPFLRRRPFRKLVPHSNTIVTISQHTRQHPHGISSHLHSDLTPLLGFHPSTTPSPYINLAAPDMCSQQKVGLGLPTNAKVRCAYTRLHATVRSSCTFCFFACSSCALTRSHSLPLQPSS